MQSHTHTHKHSARAERTHGVAASRGGVGLQGLCHAARTGHRAGGLLEEGTHWTSHEAAALAGGQCAACLGGVRLKRGAPARTSGVTDGSGPLRAPLLRAPTSLLRPCRPRACHALLPVSTGARGAAAAPGVVADPVTGGWGRALCGCTASARTGTGAMDCTGVGARATPSTSTRPSGPIQPCCCADRGGEARERERRWE